jgi:hypothetical protein
MSTRFSRRELLRLASGGVLAGLAAACSSSTAASPTPPAVRSAPDAASKGTSGLTATVASSELVIGPNRFALALLESGRGVVDATVGLEFFTVEGNQATKQSDAPATLRTIDGSKGVYTARNRFDRPGTWGVQATVTRPDQAPLAVRTAFEVKPSGAAPSSGARAIASRVPTAAETPNLSDICSAQPPCEMHALGIQGAFALGKPLVIAFATPGYCTSQTCAPVLAEVQKLLPRRQVQASFVHVEIYKDPRNLVVADAVREWSLPSEPWVFFVDRDGVIRDRIDGLTTVDELDESLASLV